ncbi:hypothetical protein AB0758_45650 [Tolypothrix bouteillei VB521301_2]
MIGFSGFQRERSPHLSPRIEATGYGFVLAFVNIQGSRRVPFEQLCDKLGSFRCYN